MADVATALRDAGYQPSEERLRDIAIHALTSTGRNWDAAKDALFAAVRNDAGLLWTMFEPWRSAAAQRLLQTVMNELRENERRDSALAKADAKHEPATAARDRTAAEADALYAQAVAADA